MPENKSISRGDLIWEKLTRRSYAKIEFIAVQDLVEQKRAEGYSIKLIYEALSKAGYISMGYTTFCDYLRGKGERLHGKKNVTPKQSLTSGRTALTQSQVTQKKVDRPENSSTYIRDKTPLEDLI